MAIEDLDLEFEDEDEVKDDALAVDVDLSFSASNETKKSAASNQKVVGGGKAVSALDATDPNLKIPNKQPAKPAAAATTPKAQPTQNPMPKPAQAAPSQPVKPQPTQTPRPNQPAANVANLAAHRAATQAPANQSVAQARVTEQQVQNPIQAPVGLEDYQYELNLLRAELDELRKEIQQVKNQADVKVAVAEAKSEFIIEHVSNAKLLDHQVNSVLQMIHKKVPGLKNEVLTIKKYLTEFLQKHEKKK
jgi:hypothetical protein